ncbi:MULTISPECIES: hypothetical protein [unclassified Pseudomonas]|uniref:hypothetical protein n=1 Tax=unclassified Pseudomonas TaxID=196821 RepID=UPI0011133482|nr:MULTISPECIES: hypothetical protein [unclassified Pseudomonas]
MDNIVHPGRQARGGLDRAQSYPAWLNIQAKRAAGISYCNVGTRRFNSEITAHKKGRCKKQRPKRDVAKELQTNVDKHGMMDRCANPSE